MKNYFFVYDFFSSRTFAYENELIFIPLICNGESISVGTKSRLWKWRCCCFVRIKDEDFDGLILNALDNKSAGFEDWTWSKVEQCLVINTGEIIGICDEKFVSSCEI